MSASAPWQPSEAFSRIHFPAAQICMTLSAIQNPAPSLKDRPAHAQPLAGTGRRYVGGSWSASGGGDGAGWARAAESKRALIKIVLASIRIIAPFVDAPPSHAGHRIIIRDYDTSIAGNRERFLNFSRCRFSALHPTNLRLNENGPRSGGHFVLVVPVMVTPDDYRSVAIAIVPAAMPAAVSYTHLTLPTKRIV